MNLPDDSPPATAIQNIHDETQTSKPSAEKTNPNNNSNENIELFKNVTAPFTTKNKKQSSISDLVMLTKEKMGVLTTTTIMKEKKAMAKIPSVTAASSMQPPQRYKATDTLQNAPWIFAQKSKTMS